MQRRSGIASSSPAVCAANSTTASIATRLIVPDLKLQFGERIQCVGQSAELGSWYLNAAPILAWTEGDNWVHHLQLPTGHHEFKLLITRDDGTNHWEQGPNRSIEVPERIDGIFEVKCQFEFTTSTETGQIPFPVKQQDLRAIRQAEADVEHSKGKGQNPKPSKAGRSFHNDIIGKGKLPDAMEGDSTEREPDRLSDAKNKPQRFSWETDKKDDGRRNKDQAFEGENPPQSDRVWGTEPSRDNKNVKRKGNSKSQLNGPELIVSPHKDSTWSASGQATMANGRGNQSVDLNRPELTDLTKRAFQARGRSVQMYGGAEAKELDDGSVLVKFPSDDSGEDILTLVQRLLGDKIDLDSIL